LAVDEATGPIVDKVVGPLLFLKYEDEIDAIEGWLTLEEGRRLAYLASTVPAKQAIVELGSWKGKSTAYLAAGSKFGHCASVFAVDHWVGHPELQYLFPDPSTTTLPEFLRNMEWQGHLDIVTPLSGKTVDVARTWTRPIGLLFIDAAHEYEAVKEDFLAWSPFVGVGGWVAFHDAGAPGPRQVIGEEILGHAAWGEIIAPSLFAARRMA
jgi:hypothetical protein